jgi:hypothetical protein
MKIMKPGFGSLLLVIIVVFMSGIQASVAISSSEAPVSTLTISSNLDPSQTVLVIPEKGYYIHQPGNLPLTHGVLSDPIGLQIQATLSNDSLGRHNIMPSNPANEIMVTNSADQGLGSLRWAIEQANLPGPDVIHFSISNVVISPATDLPAIVDNGTYIDASPNWNGIWPQGKPGITINGSNDTSGKPTGLMILGTDNVVIVGLEIEHFDVCVWIVNATGTVVGEGIGYDSGGRMLIHNCAGPGIEINGGQENRVAGSYIGTSDNGNDPEPNGGDGITIIDSGWNDIGGPFEGESNVIGASDYGIRILGNKAIYNEVNINNIGMGSFSGDIGNVNDGIYIGNGATNNVVGGWLHIEPGRDPEYLCPKYANHIENNGGNGLTLSGVGSVHNGVMGNIVYKNHSNGIEVTNGAQENLIACNTIADNINSGIFVHQPATSGNWISENSIGIDLPYGLKFPNGNHGIGLYDGTSGNHVNRNYIGNNGWSGVAIVGPETSNNSLDQNHIGMGMNGEPMGNAFFGVDIVQSQDNTLTENVIANNGTIGGSAGVHIGIDNAVGNALYMNSIYANSGLGIELTDRSQHEIGAPVINSATCSVVSGIAGPVGARVEIFSDSSDEGRYFEGSTTVNAQYQWTYSGSFRGPNLTAIVTDLVMHDSSAFSAPWQGVGHCNVSFLPLIFK